ncbi:MAG: hypothetical protein ACOX4Z_00545 [Desulfobulbus sp.]|jgi:hypothetical protein
MVLAQEYFPNGCETYPIGVLQSAFYSGQITRAEERCSSFLMPRAKKKGQAYALP